MRPFGRSLEPCSLFPSLFRAFFKSADVFSQRGPHCVYWLVLIINCVPGEIRSGWHVVIKSLQMYPPFPLLLHTGLHRRFIYPPSIFPPGHQHFVDCFCFATAFLGLFVKCWSFFCVSRLFSCASCEGSGAHCVFLATWNRTENKMNLCFHFFLCLFPPEQLN